MLIRKCRGINRTGVKVWCEENACVVVGWGGWGRGWGWWGGGVGVGSGWEVTCHLPPSGRPPTKAAAESVGQRSAVDDGDGRYTADAAARY